MSVPLEFLNDLSAPPAGQSLGDQLAEVVTDNGRVSSLLDCLATTDKPALYSPDMTRPPLTHAMLHDHVKNFALPTSGLHERLGPNDRIMLALPTGAENAVVIMSIASYHTGAPVNFNCTATELAEDAHRLKAKAVVTTRDAANRLELRKLRKELGAEIIFVHPRALGAAGLYDLSIMTDSENEAEWDQIIYNFPPPSKLHYLTDQSLVLHTSGTSGKKKVSHRRRCSRGYFSLTHIAGCTLQPPLSYRRDLLCQQVLGSVRRGREQYVYIRTLVSSTAHHLFPSQ